MITEPTSGASARPLIAAAALPSAASLAWTMWSLTDMLPAPMPVGIAAGGVLDVALVAAVAIAWVAPAVARPAKTVGWSIALLAAVLVGWHAAQIHPILVGLGLIPLVSKGLWHLALNARLARLDALEAVAAQEAQERRLAEAEEARRQAELSTDLTHEQRADVARRLQEAAYARELASAERELERARAQAAHEAELDRIRLAAEQQREKDREDARVLTARQELIREIRAGQGIALGSGDVPDDLSSLPAPEAALMGFGQAMVSPPQRHPEELEPRLRDLLDYMAAAEAPSVRGAARALGCDAATVRRRRDALAEQGYDVSPLTRTTK